jgi:hypothetical protein
MQLYHPKQLARRFRSQGYRTMDEIAGMPKTESAKVAEQLQLGAGDTQKLLQGLDRYRNGTFKDFYQLPLEQIVEPSVVSRSTQAGSSRPGVDAWTEADLPGSAAAAAAALTRAVAPAAVAAATNRGAPRGVSTLLETLWVGTSWSGVAISALVVLVVKCLNGGPVKSNSRSGKLIEVLLQIVFVQGLALTGITLPVLSLTHLLCGLLRPVRSVGLGTLGGLTSGSAAALALCMSTRGDCFDSGARVLLPNRTYKCITDIVEGDLILSFNRGVFRVKRVLSRTSSQDLQPMCRISYRLPNGEVGSIETTFGHPLWVAGKGWRVAPDLNGSGDTIANASSDQAVQIDDIFVHFTGAAARVVSMEPYSSSQPACNIVVDGPGTFFVNSILVHTSMQDSRPQLQAYQAYRKTSGQRLEQCKSTKVH